MHGLELSLQVLVDLKSVAHILVVHVLVRDLKWHKELGGVRLSSEILQPAEKPIENVLQSTLLTMDNITTIVRVKITWIAKYFEEAANTLLSLLLGLFLHVDGLMGLIKVCKDAINELKKFERRLIIKFYHA